MKSKAHLLKRAIWLKSLFLTACLLLATIPAFSQTKTVTGTVTDAAGDALIGVSILVQGSNNGVVTDLDGKYTLNNVPENATLIISYIGMLTQEVKVNGHPVCAHLGLTPQSVNAFGGFKVQGKGEAAAQKLLDDARAVEEAGAFAVVLECVPQALATKITESIHIPTIGIGAGAGCDGQVLVYQDMLAMYSNMKPKFVKQFAQVGEQMREAFRTYKEEVAAGTFPAAEHTFKMDETVLDKLY